jgi:hypothetical protein
VIDFLAVCSPEDLAAVSFKTDSRHGNLLPKLVDGQSLLRLPSANPQGHFEKWIVIDNDI